MGERRGSIAAVEAVAGIGETAAPAVGGEACEADQGLSPARVVFVHGLRNALIPVLTVFGLQVGALLAGAVLTETIFSWPGIGKWLIEAIGARDYPVVQNGILLIACLVILVNFVVDILYGLVNPRIRHQR